jgi:foldase protein PrsA
VARIWETFTDRLRRGDRRETEPVGKIVLPLRRLLLGALLLMSVDMAGCSPPSLSGTDTPAPTPSAGSKGESADESVGVVAGRSISRSELTDHLLSSYGADALREIMLHEAVKQEAAKLGLTVSAEELEQELRSMREGYDGEDQFYAAMQKQLGLDRNAVREDAKYRLLQEKLATRHVQITEQQIARYYKEHERDYAPRRQFELAWIVTTSKAEADNVLAQLEQGADFDTLASRCSVDDLTADSGGYLGWVDDNDSFQDPRVLQAAAGLNVGETAGPVRTDAGYAVVRLKGSKTTAGQPLSVVREDIRRQLAMEQAIPVRELEQQLLTKYGAQVLDPRLAGAIAR